MEMPLGLQALMPDVGSCQPVCNGTKGYLQKLSLVPMNQSQQAPSIPDKDQPRHGLTYYVRIRVDGQLHEDKVKLRSSDFTPAPLLCGTCASASVVEAFPCVWGRTLVFTSPSTSASSASSL